MSRLPTTKHTISIEIDTTALSRCTGPHLAALWHVAQANPAPRGDHTAGELAAAVGFEIIRRWLRNTEPELHHHQAKDYYWNELRQLGKWRDGEFVPGGTVGLDGRVVAPDERLEQALTALLQAWDDGKFSVGPTGDALLRTLAQEHDRHRTTERQP